MERRRKYIIDKKIQGLYIIITAVAVLLTSISVGIAVYCFFFSSFTEQIGAINLVVSDFKIITAKDIIYLISSSIALLLLSICIGLFFVFYTHRIAGPLWRIKATIDEVNRGNYSLRIKIRKYDYLQLLVDSFNQMLDTLEKRVSK